MASPKRSELPQGHRFAADLLERGAAGYAGFAATEMVEGDAAFRERQGADALASWRSHLTQQILELAAAVAAGEPRLFTGRVTWTRKAFRARGQDEADLGHSLRALRATLAARLPAPAAAVPLEYVDAALRLLEGPPPALDHSELDPARPSDRLALEYLHKILEGHVAEAIAAVVRAAGTDFSPQALYTDVLLPAQREVGRLWHAGELAIAEEHMVTSATQRVMAVIASQAPAAPSNGSTVVVAAVAGNVHDVGLRALADMYQLAGWRVIFVGADVPMQDLPNLLTFFEADLLMLGATLATHVPRVEHAIRAIRDRCERPVKIVVGGAAFDEAPDLAQRVGSDAYAPTIDGALTVGARLVGLQG
jgi:MerR family transcriptional regulator, light-induced transcriptional regulator